MASDCNYCAHRLYAEDKNTLTECTLSHGKPCLACERQVKLRERIEETKKLLDGLIIEEREARIDINRKHDPFQAHGIPTEIASYIFHLTLPPFTLQQRSYISGRPTLEIYRGLDALTLGAVCRAWRQSVWSMPHMWSDIMLDLHREPTQNMVDVMKEWLERSNPLPLNIRIFLAEVVDKSKRLGESEDNSRCSFTDLTSLFDKHSHRWTTLSIQSPGWLTEFIYGNRRGAPLLTTLQLFNFDCDDDSDDLEFMLKGPKPRPTRIDIAGHPDLSTLTISWKNITHATVHGFDLAFYVQFLKNTPRMVNLRLDRASFSHRPTIKTRRLKHNLQVLYISPGYVYRDDDAVAFCSIIFDSVALPLLEELTLKGPDSGLLNKVQQFLERCSSPLTHLDVKTKCDQQEALDLLYSLPSLKSVTLDLQTLDERNFNLETLFDHLTCAPIVTDAMPQRPEFLPNLAGLKYILNGVLPCPIPWGRLPNVRRPLSGRPERPLLQFLSFKKQNKDMQAKPLFDKSDTNIDENAIRGLIGLLDDDVELYLPNLVSREDLLALLA